VGEHIPHLVKAHGAPCRFAPILEQCAALAIFVRDRLAIVTTRNAGTNFGHLHQAVPKALTVNFKILTDSSHRFPLLCDA
jgi:hypothetical protein